MTPAVPCNKCGKSIDVCNGVEAIICPKCVMGEENWLDHQVLTPQNCIDMREDRGMDVYQAARVCDSDTYPRTIQAFERGSRPCPDGLKRMIYEWWIGG